jgi:hypothetical protein
MPDKVFQATAVAKECQETRSTGSNADTHAVGGRFLAWASGIRAYSSPHRKGVSTPTTSSSFVIRRTVR